MLDDGLNKATESKQDSQLYSAVGSVNNNVDSTRSSSTIVSKPNSAKSKKVAKTKEARASSVGKNVDIGSTESLKQNVEVELVDDSAGRSSVARDLFSLAIRRTRQRLTNNWNAKLASVILAILVWSLISANERAVRQLTVPVPLTVLGQPTISEAYPLPKSVEVKLSGANSRLEDLKLTDVTATLDLRSVSGEFQRRVRITRPRGIVIDSYEPEIIAGTVE